MRAVTLSLALALVLGCGSAELRGATSVHRGEEPDGEPQGRFVAEDCRDRRDQPAAPPGAEVALLRLADQRKVLLELRPGHDSVVVSNHFVAHGDDVFQFISDDGDGPKLLHELRFGKSRSSGALLVADLFEQSESHSGFRARAQRVVLRCALSSFRGPLDTPHIVE